MPGDWYAELGGTDVSELNAKAFPTRREAEGAAALAFAKLPSKRRAELLAGTGPEPKAAKRKKKPKTKTNQKKPKPKPKRKK